LGLCEEAIRTGIASVEKMVDGSGKISDRWAYLSVGEGLVTIYFYKLYREVHRSFEQYCQSCWHMPLMTAYRFILIYQTVLTALHQPEFEDFWKKTNK